MTTFDISKDLEQFLPSTSEDEKAALKESLKADGCLNPLTVWQERKVLVDGHNRYRICVEMGIPFTITERSFPDVEAVKEWMLVQQLCRRNLSDQHRKWCLGKLYEARKSRKGQHEGNQYTRAKMERCQNDTFPKVSATRARDQIAAEHGTAPRTIARSAVFTRTVDQLAGIYGNEFRTLCLNTNKFTDGSLKALLELHGKDPTAARSVVNVAPNIKQAEVTQSIRSALDDWAARQTEDVPDMVPVQPVTARPLQTSLLGKPEPVPVKAPVAVAAPPVPSAPPGQPKRPSEPQLTKVELADGRTGYIQSRPGYRSTFNETNSMVDWAKWTWNPITGCHHGCEYCYARDIALSERMKAVYPTGFEPTFHPERLMAPANTPATKIYGQKDKNVFVCSMADLFGKWVPLDWIKQVMDAMIANPQWTYLCLTKFPQRLKDINDLYGGFPDHVWVGTSIDNQARVGLAERCFKDIDAKVKWLSVEPLITQLRFDDLTGFNWVVIGGQSAQNGLPSFTPPLEWVGHIYDVAKRDGCKVFCKTENMPIMTREVAW